MLVDEPLSPMDVDQELWAVLDLCSDDELEALYSILHSTSPFSPVLKSLMVERDEPALLPQRGRRSVMHRCEGHLRFLAADSGALLRGRRPSYREILLDVRDKLDIRCSRNLSTFDLETEIFLHVMANCVEYVQVPQHGAAGVDPAVAASFATASVVDVAADGGAGAGGSGKAAASTAASTAAGSAQSPPQSPPQQQQPQQQQQHWTERVTAPFRLGGLKELAPTLVHLAGVLTVTKVGQQATQQLGSALLCSHMRYAAALRAATGAAGGAAAAAAAAGGLGAAAKGAVAGWGKQAVLEAAARSLTSATARYSALRGALGLLGPLMWGGLALDLALKAMGPDYARVVRAVFLLSQVRLVRTHGFVSAEMEGLRGGAVPGSGGPGDDEDDWLDPGAAFL